MRSSPVWRISSRTLAMSGGQVMGSPHGQDKNGRRNSGNDLANDHNVHEPPFFRRGSNPVVSVVDNALSSNPNRRESRHSGEQKAALSFQARFHKITAGRKQQRG